MKINLNPRVLSYPSLRSEREREQKGEREKRAPVGSGHMDPEQN